MPHVWGNALSIAHDFKANGYTTASLLQVNRCVFKLATLSLLCTQQCPTVICPLLCLHAPVMRQPHAEKEWDKEETESNVRLEDGGALASDDTAAFLGGWNQVR